MKPSTLECVVHCWYERDWTLFQRLLTQLVGRDIDFVGVTIGRNSKIDASKIGREFNAGSGLQVITDVEDEFDGFKKGANILAEYGSDAALLVNDTVGFHWKTNIYRKSRLSAGVARFQQRSGTKPTLLASEKHFARTGKFPGSGGFHHWYTSNMFLTNDPSILANAVPTDLTMPDVTDMFLEQGLKSIPIYYRRFKGIEPTQEQINQKIVRVYKEMILSKNIDETFHHVDYCINGNFLPYKVMHRLFDKHQ